MEENFVSYDLAVKLKELKFIEPCFAVWYKSSSDGYSLQANPLKLDDIYAIEPLATFQNNVNRVDAMDSIIKYNFNEFFEDVDAEGNKFDPVYSAPLYQQVTKWLREVHGIHIIINYDFNYSLEKEYYSFRVRKLDSDNFIIELSVEKFYTYNTYEQALEAGILESLKLIKDEN